MSQRQLAELAGISGSTVRLLEGGQGGAYPRTLRKLSTALGVAPAALSRGHRPERGDGAEA